MIHPGYGFLSENAEFAQKVEDAGLIWIGPTPDTIKSLGDKVSARELAMKCDVPVVPGTPGPVEKFEEVKSFTDEFGFPIIIKAAFGGGGRGMRVVWKDLAPQREGRPGRLDQDAEDHRGRDRDAQSTPQVQARDEVEQEVLCARRAELGPRR